MQQKLKLTYKQLTVTLATACVLIVGNQNCAPGFSVDAVSIYSESSLGGVASLSEFDAFGETGLRRLTRNEVSNSLSDIFGVTPDSTLVDLLPQDGGGVNIYDNDYKAQGIDSITVMNYESFADQYATKAVAVSGFVSKIAGCTPQNATDSTCFKTLVKKAGRRLLRRAISDTEADAYVTELMSYAKDDNNFNTAAQLLFYSYIMNPEFLYRVEREVNSLNNGTIFQLNDYEIATRISYFIQGTGPDEELLDLAEEGKLHDSTERASQAQRLLQTSKARTQFNDFHGQWFGYASQDFSASLKADLFQESNKLYERVTFDENRNWMDIFTFEETYLTPQLATLYGLSSITKAGWQKYPTDRAGGVLSHGTFAILGAKFGDTSPTLRGYNLYKKLFCGKLGSIPSNVDVNNAPGSASDCKTTRYSMRQTQSCATCHDITDGLGFGLERVGANGEWRTVETNLPQCSISAAGNWENKSFSGPGELGKILHQDSRVPECAAQQLFTFMSGRVTNSDDAATLKALGATMAQNNTMSNLIIELIKTPAIMYHQPGRIE